MGRDSRKRGKLDNCQQISTEAQTQMLALNLILSSIFTTSDVRSKPLMFCPKLAQFGVQFRKLAHSGGVDAHKSYKSRPVSEWQ